MEQLQLAESMKKLLVAPPVLPWREFANWIQVTEDTVDNWIKRGYVPTVKIGRFRMINVALLTQQLLNEECEV